MPIALSVSVCTADLQALVDSSLRPGSVILYDRPVGHQWIVHSGQILSSHTMLVLLAVEFLESQSGNSVTRRQPRNGVCFIRVSDTYKESYWQLSVPSLNLVYKQILLTTARLSNEINRKSQFSQHQSPTPPAGVHHPTAAVLSCHC